MTAPMTRTARINPERLAVVQSMDLDTGKHASISKGACGIVGQGKARIEAEEAA